MHKKNKTTKKDQKKRREEKRKGETRKKMIKGILTGILLATLITATTILYLNINGNIQENIITGAVIGTEGINAYATITIILTTAILLFLYLIMKKKNIK